VLRGRGTHVASPQSAVRQLPQESFLF
jgi:hypothetical protein